jgi:polyisoprenyl-teichoic acid--peptidoglycan teichoic acid transferase
VAELHVRRRSVLSALLAAPLAAAGCSGDEKPKAQPSTPSTTTTTAKAPPKPAVTGKGLPADLLQTMTALYLGGKVPASRDQQRALAKRKVVKASLAVVGRTGTWKGSPIAVVTRGKDVTLLVKAKSWTVVGGWWPSLGVARVPRRTMRILAIGSDARTNQRVDKCRADALQIIAVDNKGVGGIVGIPRDSWVALATGGFGKINAALALGGPKAQVRTVARASGLPIDGYVMTGFKGFRGMVSAVGGFPFVAKRSLRSVDGYQIVKAGRNRLNYKTALGLARERKHLSNGDFGRSANQGLMIKAGIAAAQAAGPAALATLLTKMSPHLATDLPASEVLNLCAALYLSKASSVPNRVVAGSVGNRSGQSVVLLGSSARSTFRDLQDARIGA